MKYSKENQPLVCMQTQSTCYKETSVMKVKGILMHSTGANNPNLKRYIQPSDKAINKDEMIEKSLDILFSQINEGIYLNAIYKKINVKFQEGNTTSKK